MHTNDTNTDRHLVAVYGSLLAGLGNHRVLRDNDAEHVADGLTVERFAMRDVARGSYPGIFEGGDAPVVVEVYSVDDDGFAALDCLEGYPRFYGRREVVIATDDGDNVVAWIYIMPDDYEQGDLVCSGDWRQWKGATR
jgi:gamma-glutamylcyclotransferase (GGCT)/AIG2-like uncharacterized protein YtfP